MDEFSVAILITCETAGTKLPELLFADQDSGAGLSSDLHSLVEGPAVDPVGNTLADRLAQDWGAQCLQNPFRADLIDVTRSRHHRKLFGELGQKLSEDQRQTVIEQVYAPYRKRVEEAIERLLQQFNFMVHLSLRSFDLHHAGKLQRTDVGLQYDPSREDELDLCVTWIDELYDVFPNLRVRRNYPRRGTVDSLTKTMRGKYPEGRYLGIEVWMNRAWAGRDSRRRDEALAFFADSLRVTIGMPSQIAA